MTHSTKSAFDVWWDYVCDFRDLAEESVDSADDDILQWKLHQDDWFLYLISNVIAHMNNCGSLVTALAASAKYQSDLELALHRFGFPSTTARVQASIDLYRDYEERGEWTNDHEKQCKQIEAECDWSYEKLVGYLRDHDEDFGHSIMTYCD